MRISVFGFLGDGGGRSPVDRYIDYLRRVRDEGFTRLWTAQLPHEPDLLTTMAVALREVDGIEVGTGVLPIQVQHPMALAQRALTVNLISGGRLTLGLGLSHKVVSEYTWGVTWDRPVRRMSEFLDGLLPLLAGDKADATGEFTSTRGELRIPGAPTPPSWWTAAAHSSGRCSRSPRARGWAADGEALLRRHKPAWYEGPPRPRLTVLGDRLVPFAGAGRA